MSYERSTIIAELSRIQDRALILPDIQRDFVWPAARIYRLLDSILRGYPFGTLLYWNTRDEIQYRAFTQEWRPGLRPVYQVKPAGTRGTVVLDGQQRLQSLYLAVFGSYEGKVMHVDLLSGLPVVDVSQLRYRCEFLAAGEDTFGRNAERAGQVYWVPLRDIACIGSRQRLSSVRTDYLVHLGLANNSEEGARLTANLDNLYHAFRSDELLTHYSIDRDYGSSGQPTRADEILEIFARVNSGGQLRTSADLMFSLLKLRWHGAATEINGLLDRLSRRAPFEFDKEFVLKCALTCAGQGARNEGKKFRDADVLGEISANFDRLSRALESTAEFVVTTALLVDSRIAGPLNTLVPFVYFLYHQPDQRPRDEPTLRAMNHALYLALMTRAFARYADNRIDRVVREVLDPGRQAQPGDFPLAGLQAFLAGLDGQGRIDDALLQANLPLLINILECGSPPAERSRARRYAQDHIFPAGELDRRGFAPGQINHFANLRLHSKPDEGWVRDQDPGRYFADHPEARTRYFIPAGNLDHDRFPEFLEERRRLIWERIGVFLGQSA
jgi:hypothetical protein